MGEHDPARPWLALYGDRPASIRPEHPSVLAMWRATVDAHRDDPFVLWFDHPLTFGEVDRLSDALAAAFAGRGVERGDRVALYLQNVPQFPIALLATWKVGAIPASFNPMLKRKEVGVHLGVARPKLLVCLESLFHDVVAGELAEGVEVVTTSELDLLGDQSLPAVLAGIDRRRADGIDDLLELAALHDGRSVPDPGLGPDDVAFLTFTSGTTGPPKGAMNTHGNVVFNAQTYRDWVGVDSSDVLLCIAPLFHITGLVAHTALAMLTGAPLVLAHRFDPSVTLQLIERHRATYAVAAITAFLALLDHPALDDHDVSSLRKIYSGGAPIPPAVADRFEARWGAYIHNIYGLTETTSPSHGVPFGLRAPVDPTSGALSVGVPTFDTICRVLDDDGNELPPGEIGELVTSGPQVVPGYWEQPEETANAIPGGQLHTGDVGFRDEAGWFFVVDRRKDQINASGYKVWPREVEDVLYEHPAVREAAVVGVPDEYRGETVKAFITVKPGATVDPAEVVAFCRERMAAYKYPRQVEVVDELPKTATGKILRRELRGR